MSTAANITRASILSMAISMRMQIDEAVVEVLLRDANNFIRAGLVIRKRAAAPRYPTAPVTDFQKFPPGIRRILGHTRLVGRLHKARGTTLSQEDVVMPGESTDSKLSAVAGTEFKVRMLRRRGERYVALALIHNDVARFEAPVGACRWAHEILDATKAESSAADISLNELRALRPWRRLERYERRVYFCAQPPALLADWQFRQRAKHQSTADPISFLSLEIGNVLTLFGDQAASFAVVRLSDNASSFILWAPFVCYALVWPAATDADHVLG